MTGDLVAGIDVGTSSTKGVLVDRRGRVIAHAQVPNATSRPGPGMVEQDADAVWWAGFCHVTNALLRQARRMPDAVACVGISAIGPCVLPLGDDGRPLRPGILYGIDTRAWGLLAGLEEQCARRGSPVPLSTQSVLPKLVWLARHEPDVWARAAAVVGAEGYLVRRLTGQASLDYYDAGPYDPLVDWNTETWSSGWEDLCPRRLLPTLMWPTETAGTVTDVAGAQCGLVAGTPVVCGMVDAPAEAIGVGAVRPGDVVVMLGSTGFLIAQTDHPVADRRLWPARGFEPGRHVVAGGMNTVGTLLSWCAELLAPGAEPAAALAGLLRKAGASRPGAHGIRVLPYWEGERTPVADPGARGVIVGLHASHTAGDVMRATLEGIALGVRDNIEAMQQAGAQPQMLYASGGAARSMVLLRAIADACGLPVVVPAHKLGAPVGDAVRAAVGAGWFTTLQRACDAWVRPAGILQPHPENRQLYDDLMATYRKLYHATRPLLSPSSSG